jgi:hypothetical protein
MSKPNITVNVHVNSDVPIAAADYGGFVTVSVGEDLTGAALFLNSHDDAMRLVAAASQAAEMLLAEVPA